MDVRDQLAEERTLLAWIRTGLALMGFGFAVARFGAAAQPKWLSVGLGTVLIAANDERQRTVSSRAHHWQVGAAGALA